jgi:hypothetical protein
VGKVEVLCNEDKAMLSEFSRRALEHITGRSHNSLQLPFITGYMNANVAKEFEKDRIIIEHAASAFAANTGVNDLDVDDIFERTKTVDRTFVKGLMIPSLAINVRYEDIADIRKQRIRCLSKAVFDLLQNWDVVLSFEARVRQAWSEQEFKAIVAEILHLYNQETRMLSNSVTFLNPFSRALNFIAEPVFDAMEDAAEELTADCAARIFRVKSHV